MYISIPVFALILIGAITAAMYVGLLLGAVLPANKRLPELPKSDLVIPIKSCETCKHSVKGNFNCRNNNCAKCLTEYAFAGWEVK